MNRLEIQPGRRYLVKFDPKRIPHTFTDVLVIGGGIAGLRAALAVDPDQDRIVVTKNRLTHSNSVYAQGGIAGVLDPLDDVTNHAADTVAAGKGLCDQEIVNLVVKEAPEHIRELIAFGANFDQHEGRLALTQEGGHSHRRVAHALGDATGKELMRALRACVQHSERIQVWENTFTIDLITHDGQCRGALVWNGRHGRTFIWAKQTILATGGAGCLYRETTNPDVATADGHAIAFRAGADVRDMEFMQFHPTVLYIAGSSRHLISEAVRGEGGILRDVKGTRFMPEYDERGELAPRDVVSQSITRQMHLTNHPCVYLDLTHVDSEHVRNRFPSISKVCLDFGIDITRDLIPVRPGAHYMIGGIQIDARGESSLPGLWAAGEAASSGLHGANRLGSNSLIEGLVFGRRAGQSASRAAHEIPDTFQAIQLDPGPPVSEVSKDEALNLVDLRNSLTSLMWRNVGIEREESSLQAAAEQMSFWNRYVTPRTFQEPSGWEFQNLLLAARLVIAAALMRRESRGVHFRSDFPQTRSEAPEHIVMQARY